MVTVSRFATEESRWQALLARDQHAKGVFVYAVKTTGIYCHPGCASRLPKRENTLFFDTVEEAVQAGYRPCKRCKPDAISAQTRVQELITQACRQIDESEAPPTLASLAAQAGLSQWHFQRVFKTAVGMTPKQYAKARQVERFRDSLKESESVTSAIYDAGFGSSSRAYENTRERLAMSPSLYRKGGAGLTIRYAITSCFLGWITVAATDKGICAIEFGDDPATLLTQLQDRFPKALLSEADKTFSELVQQVIAFIKAPSKGIELPLDIQGTAFQEKVWQALREVPPGSTVSYTDIAQRIGSPKAVRAVAQACASNKLAVIVPCHRVVRSDGALSGYRWGVERKRELLKREKDTSKS
ncbi:bifunctional DNA-binding transcriptional regulator/O6-methylguanine-DNA methyltransferase Ada [Nitrincola alkalilacustris]|uniref:bifunctional DNA-binding transcriptional regulator/O6-methylguanine-DNA methyltransferase Ada n=1 Tax=Nitrincola alkalilacustris TaxID=1571224 RepID=UPI00124BEFFE|nr:bifunctional DNA-binding transcriptional regulator/O6-methylguanine-DNA methyltransferase Ada [Nitrincola alkalilacustris]